MNRLPITFAAVLLSTALLALACLPGRQPVDADHQNELVFDLAQQETPCFCMSTTVEGDRRRFVDARRLATSEPFLHDNPPQPPTAGEYLHWAWCELGDALHARSAREAWRQIRSAGWYVGAAWEAAGGVQ